MTISKRTKTILGVVALAAFMILIFLPFFFSSSTPEETRAAEQQERQHDADRAVRNTSYVQDPRTGLCFAVVNWNGPSLATVPCDRVPPDLLTVGQPKE